MSIFSNLFGDFEKTEASASNVNWIPLIALEQLEDIAAPIDKAALIFKHSTRCSISRFALKRFEKEFDSSNAVDAYFLDLLEYRDISNEIASRFGVLHQSPQLILIKGGKAVYDVSHDAIDAEVLKGKL